MSESNRRDLLERLHSQLADVEPLDAQGQQVLDEARAELERALTDTHDTGSLVERLEEAVYHFEGTHPDLSTAITIFIDTLSNMGI